MDSDEQRELLPVTEPVDEKQHRELMDIVHGLDENWRLRKVRSDPKFCDAEWEKLRAKLEKDLKDGTIKR